MVRILDNAIMSKATILKNKSKNLILALYTPNYHISFFVLLLQLICLPLYLLWQLKRFMRSRKTTVRQFNLKREQKPDIVIILLNVDLNVGSDKSILNYLAILQQKGKKIWLETGQKISSKGTRLLKKTPANTIVFINGLKSFIQDHRLSSIGIEKSGWFIYLHECKVIYTNKILNLNPTLHTKLLKLFPNQTLLTVSEQQSQFYATTFNIESNKIKTVYNFIKPTEAKPLAKNTREKISQMIQYNDQLKQYETLAFDSEKIHIIMVGSCQPRKGVSFFSRVADEAHRLHKPWQFHWVGIPKNIPQNLYFSQHVNWISRKTSEEVQLLLKKVNLFFLSSISESFPLTICEALFAQIPCVAYKNGIGAYYELHRFDEVVLFPYYAVDQAIEAIEQAITLPSFDKTGKLQNHLKQLLSPEKFIERMHQVLNIT